MYVIVKGDWLEGRIEEEREDSKTYYSKYVETGDSLYKELAEDEARHAEMLCRKKEGVTAVKAEN